MILIFLPWVGALIYRVARGRSMSQRQAEAVSQAQEAQAQYIKRVAGTSPPLLTRLPKQRNCSTPAL